MTTITAMPPPSTDLNCCRSLIGRDAAQQFAAFLHQIQLLADRSSRYFDYQASPQRKLTSAIHRITARYACPSTPSSPTKSP
jgi:hypothetical protein